MNAKSLKPRGSILLLSLFIMLAIVGTGLTIAGLLRLQIGQARNENNLLSARYGAESALERGLDLLTSYRTDASPNAPASLTAALSAVAALPAVTGSEISYSFDADRTAPTVGLLPFSLSHEQSRQIDLFDPDAAFGSNPYPVESVAVDWVEGESCAAKGSELQLTFTQFSYADELSAVPAEEITLPCGGFTAEFGFDCRVVTNLPSAPSNYTLRVKARNCDITYGTVRTYRQDDAAGAEQSLGSSAVITVQGTEERANVWMQAEAPWRYAVSGLADYVLFSETDLTK